MLATAKTTAKAVHVSKEAGIVTGGLSAPLWLPYVEAFNTLIASFVGIFTLIYVAIRAYKAIKGEV